MIDIANRFVRWHAKATDSVIFKLSPFLWSIICSSLSVAFAVSIPFIKQHITSEYAWIFALIFLYFVLVSFSYALLVTVFKYPFKKDNLTSLFLFYLSTIIIFANLYFIMSIMSPSDLPFNNINGFSNIIDGKTIIFANCTDSIITFTNCFHYSTATATTLGLGDITPTKWYTKLATDLQVLTSLFFLSSVPTFS